MFLSTQLRKDTLFSARISQRSVKQSGQSNLKSYSHRKVTNMKHEMPKVEFRKVVIQRGKNSRVRQDDERRVKQMENQSRITFTSYRQQKDLSVREKQALNPYEEGKTQELKQSYHSQRPQRKNGQEQRKKKFSFIQKLGNAKFLKQTPAQHPSIPLNNRQKPFLLSQNHPVQRIDSALSRTPRQSKFKFIIGEKNSHQQQQQITKKKQDISRSRLVLVEDTKSARPLSSVSNKSSFSRLNNKERREDIQLINNERKNSETQRSFYTASGLNQNKQKENEQQKVYTWQEISQVFDSTENKINSLIEEKWKLIQRKLTEEKYQQNHVKENTNKNTMRKTETQSLSRFSRQPQQTQSPKKQPHQQKFSFSFLIAEKHIDIEVMNEIKKLRNLNLSKLIYSEDQALNQEDSQIIKERLQQRRSQIIEKALAESMVEAELLKKYYSGQNYNSLGSSNYKVGQQNMKQKLMLKLKNNNSPLIKNIKLSQQRVSEHRDSITKQSQNQVKFNKHNEQDYEKFRYRPAPFKPNLQPLPQSSYKSQFFNYGNIRAFDDPYKEDTNIIFPSTGGLRNSSYRSEYNQHNSAERINFRELDAYRDKYKQVNMMYLPKKRSQSQAKTLRKNKQNPKFMNQLQYVKRLKTQSLIDETKCKELASKVTKQMFLSESRKQFQNPQKPPQYYMKSQIKHKNLATMKYDFRKKVHV